MRRTYLGLAFLAVSLVTPALAEAPKTSLRPVARVDITDIQLTSASLLGLSKRPVLRPLEPIIAVGDNRQISEVRFQGWIKRFKVRARRNGISENTLDRAFRGVSYNTHVIEKDRNQNEFTKTVWDYLSSAASDTRIANGQAAMREHRRR